MCEAEVRQGVAACPFLRRVAATQGESFALKLAVNPFKPVVESGSSSPLFPEDAVSFHTAYAMFHGPQGLLPLCVRGAERMDEIREVEMKVERGKLPAPVALPVGAMSFSHGSFNGPNFFRRLRGRRKHNGGKGAENDGSGARRSSHNNSGRATNAGKNGSGGLKGRARNPRMSAGGGYGALGPLAALLPTTVSGQLRCPTPVVRMRGFVAGLSAVKGLRPHSLPVRGAALMAIAFLGNLPAGMVREHCTKFSPAWFAAVHIAIPFVAMLRKAVLLPQWALLLTMAGSMAGQTLGSRFERARLSGNLPRLEAVGRLILPPEEEEEQGAWPAFAAVSPKTIAIRA